MHYAFNKSLLYFAQTKFVILWRITFGGTTEHELNLLSFNMCECVYRELEDGRCPATLQLYCPNSLYVYLGLLRNVGKVMLDCLYYDYEVQLTYTIQIQHSSMVLVPFERINGYRLSDWSITDWEKNILLLTFYFLLCSRYSSC